MYQQLCRGGLTLLAAGAVGSVVLAQKHDEAWVTRRVQEVRQSDTTGWQGIPWVASLIEARRLSRQEQRPIFLFTLDGNLETGRC